MAAAGGTVRPGEDEETPAAARETVGLGGAVLAVAVGPGEEGVPAVAGETVGLTKATGAVSGGGELPSMALMAKKPPAARTASATPIPPRSIGLTLKALFIVAHVLSGVSPSRGAAGRIRRRRSEHRGSQGRGAAAAERRCGRTIP